MICYKDRTFCISPNCQNKCNHQLTREIVLAARKWWGSEKAPIAVSVFCGGDLEEAINNHPAFKDDEFDGESQ